MPASLTRVCPRCVIERNTPIDFRELGEVGPGRPPRICRECRHSDPELMRHHTENVARRPAARQRQSDYAARSDDQIAEDRERFRGGAKTCPEVAGCNRTLSYSAFSVNRHQADGLSPICIDCQIDHEELRAVK